MKIIYAFPGMLIATLFVTLPFVAREIIPVLREFGLQQEAIEIADKIVVINRGRVEQTESARKVYENPQSRFVASFIGQVNVLDAFAQKGRVYIKGTSIEVETDTGGRVDDGDIVILIRPEDIEIASGPQTQFLPA
ncbi:MAG: hypothetical protein R6V02_11330, partial [Candidatus Aminicenantes bacterium]